MSDAHRTPPGQAAPRSSGRARLINLLLLALLDVGLAILVFGLVDDATGNHALAYLAASVSPLLGGIVQHLRSKAFSGVSALILVFTFASAAVAVVGGSDERLLLVKDSVVTGVFGLTFLVSLLPFFRRPLGFSFGQRFATAGTAQSAAWWDGLWRYPSFRASQHLVTVVWGVVFVTEAAIRVIAAYTLPFSTAFGVSSVLPLVAFGLALAGTFLIAARSRRGVGRAASSAVPSASAVPAGPTVAEPVEP